MNPIAVQNSIFPLQAYEIFLKIMYLKLLQEYWTYEWDLWNRLVKVVQYNASDNGECVDVSYEYDALNHRISRSSGTETTKYAYGRNGALAYQEKTVGENVTKRSFAYLNNEIVGFTDKTGGEETVYYTVTDIQGSITEVYNGSSKLVWKSGYTAFGELAGEVVDLIDFDGMYTGCDYDAETGLTYHWNRWRSEDGSSFISEDPARDGMNWYGYAGQNPMVCIDPTGEFAVNILVGAVTGFISSAVINTACQIAFGVMQGQSVTESIKNIDVSSVMISGLGGAVTGAITGGMGSVKAVKDAMTMYKTVNGAVNVAANVAGVVSGALSPGATKAKDGVKESFVKMSTIGKGEKISIIKDVKMDNSIREIVVNVGQELIGNMVE